MYSRTKGTAEPGKDGGTLRFLLDGGGELHVWTGNYRNVSLAPPSSQNGQPGTPLAMQPLRPMSEGLDGLIRT